MGHLEVEALEAVVEVEDVGFELGELEGGEVVVFCFDGCVLSVEVHKLHEADSGAIGIRYRHLHVKYDLKS